MKYSTHPQSRIEGRDTVQDDCGKNGKPIYVGRSVLKREKRSVRGSYEEINGELFYKISNYDWMPPFFMSLVSASDQWMFISSGGGCTAGRKNPDNALFPYYTDDKIHDSNDRTGSKTIIFLMKADRTFLWEPFSQNFPGIYSVERNIYKNVYGNKLVFEEINHDLSVIFRTSWLNSDRFGFVKHSTIINRNRESVAVDILDGIQNLLPSGIERRFQLEYSTLADGYKKNELQSDTGLGIFMLSSVPVDRAEPSEALKATTVWSVGLENAKRLISSRQLEKFRTGCAVEQETDIRATRGAYFVNAEFTLTPDNVKEWYLVADINQHVSDIITLTKLIKEGTDLPRQLWDDIARGTENLVKLAARADGLQKTEDLLSSSRHFSNVLFNIMRGGIVDDNRFIDTKDLIGFIRTVNRIVAEECGDFLKSLPEKMRHSELLFRANSLCNSDLNKLCCEYLPLTFSRRHGDPSRPWNIFSIDIRDKNGGKILNYQGNWRDIFQNWEALALSFPDYVENMICKFVNASTADGYNPYRVTRDGFDWEVLDPHDAWSYIGYWGDHQVIYLLKLLEISMRYHPGKLKELLIDDIFTYANVPYRIKPYSDLLIDPKNTVTFDMDLECQIEKRVESMGTDGKLVYDKDGRIVRTNLAEKLLLSILTRMSNFIPGAGIWMNTQRPEWNDANNALVGFGVSVVTLCYLRRFVVFYRQLLQTSSTKQISISEEVTEFFIRVSGILVKNLTLMRGSLSDTTRKIVLDALGQAGSDYRNAIYINGFSKRRTEISVTDLTDFCELSLYYIDQTIGANKRSDNLYHAYNLINVGSSEEISIRHLYEMLEGQVAILSSGYLSPEESLEVLDALRRSALFREDQSSYLLYPDRQLPRFVEKNTIPPEGFNSSALLQRLVEDGNRQIVIRDIDGGVHFNGDFRNVNILKTALAALQDGRYQPLVQKEMQHLTDIYERMFDHRSFTGRSGTFYKYEGLGCIYWHMVSKLLLAVQEVIIVAHRKGSSEGIIVRLMDHYCEIQKGIGVHKSPNQYGAFPTDPYSHTPGHVGVQQPGMTGQVKEDIISRFGELGVSIEDGKLNFRPILLRKSEFVQTPKEFHFYDVDLNPRSIELGKNTLAFLFCQVPVIYHLSADSKIHIEWKSGEVIEIEGSAMSTVQSASLFSREGEFVRIDAFVTPGL
jgi:hypothetical protein